MTFCVNPLLPSAKVLLPEQLITMPVIAVWSMDAYEAEPSAVRSRLTRRSTAKQSIRTTFLEATDVLLPIGALSSLTDVYRVVKRAVVHRVASNGIFGVDLCEAPVPSNLLVNILRQVLHGSLQQQTKTLQGGATRDRR
jgi:hypothetical protein